MSAIRQLRPRDRDGVSPPEPAMASPAPAPETDNPLQLLRDAIDRLKSSSAGLPAAQVEDLLAEAREALERAKVIAGVVAQCQSFLAENDFTRAVEALDTGLEAYPGDAALILRRREVEAREQAFQSASEARKAIDEAEWLLHQDRVDLAVQFLRGKSPEMPDQAELLARLNELETLLPSWEQKRHVQATLGRAATLEQLQQGHAALAVIEEALRTCPASQELTDAAARIRERLAEHERRKRLARRLELIGQKIAAQSWNEAFTLLNETRREFPHAPELFAVQSEVDAGRRRSRRDAVVMEVRQSLADGDLEQAERLLRRGLELLGPEPELVGLRQELEAEQKYREDLRQAQILFGRRELGEAERILTALAEQERPEALALLDAVRGSRAETEEEDFFERGREKALDLVQTGQFAQAVDLLRNLLTLFPGNPILERDLAAARNALAQATAKQAPPAPVEEPEPEPAPPPPAPRAPLQKPLSAPQNRFVQPPPPPQGATVWELIQQSNKPSRLPYAIAGAVLLLVSSGAAWKMTHREPPVSGPTTSQSPNSAAGAPSAAPSETARVESPSAPLSAQTSAPPSAAKPENAASGRPRSDRPAASPPNLRPFVASEASKSEEQNQSVVLPPTPTTGAIITATATSLPPADLTQFVNPPAAVSATPTASQNPTPQTSTPLGGRFQEAQIVQRTTPEYPTLARQLRAFGSVRVEAEIDEHGKLKNVKVLNGHPVLAEAAKQAIQKWKFKPATLNDRPVASNMEIQISFRSGN